MKLSIQNYVRLAAECERAPNVICHTQIAADRDPCYLPVICQHCHLINGAHRRVDVRAGFFC